MALSPAPDLPETAQPTVVTLTEPTQTTQTQEPTQTTHTQTTQTQTTQTQTSEGSQAAQTHITQAPQVTFQDDPTFLPATQAELVRDSGSTHAANQFLQRAGVQAVQQVQGTHTQQNLAHRVTAPVYADRVQYPSPSNPLPPLQAPGAPPAVLMDWLYSHSTQPVARRKAIQLTDFIVDNNTDAERRLVTTADGTIKLASKQQRIYNVASWGELAMTSAIQLCRLDIAKDPRVLRFHILEYLFYLNNMFIKFNRFGLQSVLEYDKAYRTMQLREGFVWGTFVPELHDAHLTGHVKPIIPHINVTSPQHKPAKQPKVGDDWSCHRFNAGKACAKTPCRFLHQCSICLKAHPAVNCPTHSNKVS